LLCCLFWWYLSLLFLTLLFKSSFLLFIHSFIVVTFHLHLFIHSVRCILHSIDVIHCWWYLFDWLIHSDDTICDDITFIPRYLHSRYIPIIIHSFYIDWFDTLYCCYSLLIPWYSFPTFDLLIYILDGIVFIHLHYWYSLFIYSDTIPFIVDCPW